VWGYEPTNTKDHKISQYTIAFSSRTQPNLVPQLTITSTTQLTTSTTTNNFNNKSNLFSNHKMSLVCEGKDQPTLKNSHTLIGITPDEKSTMISLIALLFLLFLLFFLSSLPSPSSLLLKKMRQIDIKSA